MTGRGQQDAPGHRVPPPVDRPTPPWEAEVPLVWGDGVPLGDAPPTTMPFADALAAIEALRALTELQQAHIENLIERVHTLEVWADSLPPDV